MIPVSNARLVRVAGGGSSEDYDRPENEYDPVGAPADGVEDEELWAGDEAAYVAEKLLTEVAGEQRNEVAVTSIALATGRAGDVVKRGHTLTYTIDGTDGEVSRKALNVVRVKEARQVSVTFV